MVCSIASLSCSYTTFEGHSTFWKGAGEQNVNDKSKHNASYTIVSNGSVVSFCPVCLQLKRWWNLTLQPFKYIQYQARYGAK